MSNYYHYTKGYNVGQILADGSIAKSVLGLPGLKAGSFDFVWFTKDEVFPRTALPAVSDMPETLLFNQLKPQKPEVDLLKVAEKCAGLWRFAVPSENKPVIKSWFGSLSRVQLLKNPLGKNFEKIAVLAGDKTELWAISKAPVQLDGMTLEELTPDGWIPRIEFSINEEDKLCFSEYEGAEFEKIMENSFQKRIDLCKHARNLALAA